MKFLSCITGLIFLLLTLPDLNCSQKYDYSPETLFQFPYDNRPTLPGERISTLKANKDSEVPRNNDTFLFTGTELDFIVSVICFPFSLAYTINTYKYNGESQTAALAFTILGGSILLGGWIAAIAYGGKQGFIGSGLTGMATAMASIFLVNLIIASVLFGYSQYAPSYFGTFGNALIQDYFIGSAATFGANLIGMIIFWAILVLDRTVPPSRPKSKMLFSRFIPYSQGIIIRL